MKIRDKTVLFIVVFTVLSIIIVASYDIYAILKGGTEATISYTIFEWSYKYPIFTFSCGFFPGILAGHFFWRLRDPEKDKLISDNTRESVDSIGQGS